MRTSKYTAEVLAPIVAVSHSFARTVTRRRRPTVVARERPISSRSHGHAIEKTSRERGGTGLRAALRKPFPHGIGGSSPPARTTKPALRVAARVGGIREAH